MGELTITTFLTLDGVMQGPGGPTEDPSGGFKHGGWLVPHFDDETGAAIDEIFSRVDAFLLGRNTYDIFSGYWPSVTDPGDAVAGKLNSLPKFVASRTRTEFPWSDSSHIQDVVHEVPAIKQRFNREVQVHGSAGLAQTLIANDLIDVYNLFIFPVVLGEGKRLFDDGAVPANLRLASSRATGSGVLICTYHRAGPLKTGTVGEPAESGATG